MNVSRHSFGRLGDRDVGLTTLTSDSLELRVLDYGATVQALLVPDRQGRVEDVVLGFERVEDYVACPAFVGGIVGRVANRIANAQFELGSQRYQLDANDGPPSLAWGLQRLGQAALGLRRQQRQRQWRQRERAPEPRLSRRRGALPPVASARRPSFESRAARSRSACSAPRIVQRCSIWHTTVTSIWAVRAGLACSITSSSCTPSSALRVWCPMARWSRWRARPSISECKSRSAGICPSATGRPPGYDDNFVVLPSEGELFPVAELADPVSGRSMQVSTNQPGVQLYSGNFLDGSLSGKGRRFTRHAAVCLETQAFPNAVNVPGWREQVLLEPGQTYRHLQVFRFG